MTIPMAAFCLFTKTNFRSPVTGLPILSAQLLLAANPESFWPEPRYNGPFRIFSYSWKNRVPRGSLSLKKNSNVSFVPFDSFHSLDDISR